MHQMHPAFAFDPDGRQAVVWHIAATGGGQMLCGALPPQFTAASAWEKLPERPCRPCQEAYRRLLAMPA